MLADRAGGDSKGRFVETNFKLCACCVLLFAAFMFFARLGARSLWASEGRWAEVAREMVVSGDYFWPTINGRVYYDKPLLSYWFVVAASGLNRRVDELATRLPSACAGLMAVAILLVLGRHFYSAETALWSGLVLTTSYSFIFFSRHASADMETVTGELAALALFVKNWPNPALSWLIAFWSVMALTSLTKGLLGFVLPLLVASVYSTFADGRKAFVSDIRNRGVKSLPRLIAERNRWFFNRYTPLAVAVAAVIYLAPFALSYLKTGSNLGLYMVYRENVLRFVHPFDHRGPIWLYVPVIFALMAPWSVFLPGALTYFHSQTFQGRSDREVLGDRFVLAFFWTIFAFFTASGSRRSYYILPILPACALIVARALTAADAPRQAWARRLVGLGHLALTFVTLLGVLALLPPSVLPGRFANLPPLPHRAAFAALWLAASIAFVYASVKKTFRATLVSTFVGATLVCVYIFMLAMPAAERYRPERTFARTVVAHTGGIPDGTLVMYKIWAPGLDFYLGSKKPIPDFENPEELKNYASNGRLRWIITRSKDAASLPFPTSTVSIEPTFPWEPAERTQVKYLLLERTGDVTRSMSDQQKASAQAKSP